MSNESETKEIEAKLTLRLNTPVLNTLFPNDSPARLELSQAILREAAKTFVKGALSDDMKVYLKGLTDELHKNFDPQKVLNEHLQYNWQRGSTDIKPDSNLAKAIAKEVKNGFEKSINNFVLDKVDELVKHHQETIDDRIEKLLTYRLEQITNRKVQEEVERRLKAVLNQ